MDYSQNGEQLIIEEYFKGYKGLLLDIGANDGETLSNTRKLLLDGWTGVLIEPSKIANEKLKELYKHNLRVSILDAAVSDSSGIYDFFESGSHLKNGDTGLLSTLEKTEIDRWKNSGEEFTATTIECITYQDVCDLTGLSVFEFINIDIEGKDIYVLKTIDLSLTNMVCVEVNNSQESISEVKEYCKIFGLEKVLLLNHENIIIAR
jgi:FkbM family methyltransferase